MSKSLGIVYVPGAYGRLDQGFLQRRFAGTSLLTWVTRRVTEAQSLEHVVVAMGNSPEELDLAGCAPTDISVLCCEGDDPLDVVVGAAEQAGAADVVLVGLHHPFVDPELLDRLVKAATEDERCDYASYCSKGPRATTHAKFGLVAEWCRVSALVTAAREARDAADRNEITRYIYSRPEQFSLKLVPIPSPLDREDLRLAVTSQDDWERAEDILEALGTDRLDWQRIVDLLERHPTLRQPANVQV